MTQSEEKPSPKKTEAGILDWLSKRFSRVVRTDYHYEPIGPARDKELLVTVTEWRAGWFGLLAPYEQRGQYRGRGCIWRTYPEGLMLIATPRGLELEMLWQRYVWRLEQESEDANRTS